MLKVEAIKLAELREHPQNRKRFDETALAELASSIAQKGVLNPLLVRPHGKGYQILAGARRFRAAKLAGLEEVPAIVREMDDRGALELLVIDNLQREGVHPLEEAEGYRLLHEQHKYAIEDLAARVGKSTAYVYARMKLCELTEKAKQAFFDDQITAGHAILLARLKPADQARALDVKEEALFTEEFTLFDDKPTVKARSVREFEAWIAKYVRFDAEKADPMLFPETAAAVGEAKEESAKILALTTEHFVQPEAREGKTLGPRSWKRADGEEGSKICEYSELGVIVVGVGQGESFRVCVKKEKCKVHWAAWQRERAKRHGQAEKGGARKEQDRRAKEEAEREAERKRQDAERARWRKAMPAIADAVAAAVRKAPAKANGLLAKIVLDATRRFGVSPKAIEKHVPAGTTAEDVVRQAAFSVLYRELADDWRAPADFPKRAKALDIDVKKILDEHAPVEPPAAAAGKAGTCRVCGCTEEDCEECIEKTGEPCSWATPAMDLCTRCAAKKAPARKGLKKARAKAS